MQGREWDLTCSGPAELEDGRLPSTIRGASYQAKSEKGSASLRIVTYDSFGFANHAEVEVEGADQNWVLGTTERIRQLLLRFAVSWRWVYQPWASIPATAGVFVLWAMTCNMFLRPVVQDKEALGSLATLLGLAGTVVTILAFHWVYPNIEFYSLPSKGKLGWRAAVCSLLLGLLASGIWSVVTK